MLLPATAKGDGLLPVHPDERKWCQCILVPA